MRRLLLTAIASLVLVGCGGSGEAERAAGTPEPTASATETPTPAATTDPAADKRIAQQSTLKAEDFPSGWTSEPDDQGDENSGCEDWEAAKKATTARYDADEFSKGDTTQVINTVYVYGDEAAATEAFAKMGTDETAAGRLVLPLKVEAETIDLQIDLIFARTGRGVQLLGFLNVQEPFDAELRDQLTTTGVERLGEQLG